MSLMISVRGTRKGDIGTIDALAIGFDEGI
jgi:hypothetical protein